MMTVAAVSRAIHWNAPAPLRTRPLPAMARAELIYRRSRPLSPLTSSCSSPAARRPRLGLHALDPSHRSPRRAPRLRLVGHASACTPSTLLTAHLVVLLACGSSATPRLALHCLRGRDAEKPQAIAHHLPDGGGEPEASLRQGRVLGDHAMGLVVRVIEARELGEIVGDAVGLAYAGGAGDE